MYSNIKNVFTSIKTSISKEMLNLGSRSHGILNYVLGMGQLDRISMRLIRNDKSILKLLMLMLMLLMLLILNRMVHERFFLFLM